MIITKATILYLLLYFLFSCFEISPLFLPLALNLLFTKKKRSADYSKGFDLIDHSIPLRELACFDIDTVLINWTSAFLTGRSQAVIKDW